MTKDIYWSGTSGDKITVTYSGTAGTELPVSVSSDRNTGSSDRTKVLTFSTEPSGASAPILVSQSKPTELCAVQYGLSIPASYEFHGITVTNTGTAVSLEIPAGSPLSATVHVSKLSLVIVDDKYYIEADAGQAGYFYIVDQGSSYFMVSSVDSSATIIQNPTCPWNAGDVMYNRRSANKGLYQLNSRYTALTLVGQPSSDNLYRDVSTSKLYEYDGTTLVEIA